jgi:hypothetical protein
MRALAGRPVARLSARDASRTFALCFVALIAVIGCSAAPQTSPAESPRLHVVSVLYGRYLSAHGGQMPATRDDLVQYINENERDLLIRRGFENAQQLLEPAEARPRLIVLYRDQRDRLQTEYVAIEEHPNETRAADQSKRRSTWFAADVLGAARPIDEQQAERVLAETG